MASDDCQTESTFLIKDEEKEQKESLESNDPLSKDVPTIGIEKYLEEFDHSVSDTISLCNSTLKSNVFGITSGFSFVLFGAYQFGSYGWGMYPLLMLMLGMGISFWTLRENVVRQRQIRAALRRAVSTDEKGCILSSLQDLPSWVFFPEIERAEWLNKVIKQLWPFVGHYVKDLIKNTLEDQIREYLPTYLRSFRFEKIILGDLPPRLGGIKVYQENVARDEIVLDIDLRYFSDCYIQLSVKKFKAGIKDLQVHGTMRVILKPLVKTMPLVGGVTVFFLNPPMIDFNMTNMANVLDMPGLGDILRQAVIEQVKSFAVLPNKYTLPLISEVPHKYLKFTPPAGVLRIYISEAKDLVKADVGMLGMGKSDPYAIISVGSQEFRTPVVKNTVFPKWNFYCEAVIDQFIGQELHIEVMDEDQSSKDDFLGRISVDVTKLMKKEQSNLWLSLENVKSGSVNVQTTWLTLSSAYEDLQQQLIEVKKFKQKCLLSSSLLMVYVDSAKNLPNIGRQAVEPSPQAHVFTNDAREKTCVQYSTNAPVWEESFHFLIHNPEVQIVHFEVLCEKTGKLLGTSKLPLSRLLKEEMMQLEQPFVLNGGGPNSKIYLSLQLKILKPGEGRGEDCNLDAFSCDGCSDNQELEDQSESKRQSKVCEKNNSAASANENSEGRRSTSTIPSLEEMIQSTVSPIVETVQLASEGQSNKTSEATSPKKESPYVQPFGAGEESPSSWSRIQLTLRYSIPRNKLVVVVHKAINLPYKEGDDVPDPYVKIYLLPGRNKEGKQKTQICKNTCNPVFDESLEFDVNMSDISSYSLEVTVNTKAGSLMFPRGRILGKAAVELSQLDISKAVTEWYDLEVSDQ